MSTPRITLITPSYQQGHFIEETFRSIITQSYENLEWIVVDGGSTDGTVDVIKRYSQHMSKWISERDNGQSAALNKGFEIASGDILGWLNSDDLLLPGALHRIAETAQSEPNAVAWAGQAVNIDEKSQQIDVFTPQAISRSHLARWNAPGGNVICQPACFFSAAAFRNTMHGRLDEQLHMVMDVDLWLHLSAIGRIHTFDAPIAANRVYSQAKTYRLVFERCIEHAGLLLRHGLQEEARLYVQHAFPEISRSLGNHPSLFNHIPVASLAKALLHKFAKRIVG